MTDHLISRSDLHQMNWAEEALPALGEGMARLRVDAFALTANNVTYAAFGEAMGYWKFFPASDPAKGRVPVWGFAVVEESKVEGVDVGARVYGYLPISDRFDVQPVNVSKSSFMDGAPHRAGLAAIYNTYVFTDADPSYSSEYEAQQMLFRPLFTTGWMIDDALMETAGTVPEIVVISSASSKTALALAQCLHARANVSAIALTSARNKAFVENTGLYAQVLTYDEVNSLPNRSPTAYVNFVGRPALTAAIHTRLGAALVRSMAIGVTDWEDFTAPREKIDTPGPQPEFFFVPTYAAMRAKALGPDVLNARLGQALSNFYSSSTAFIKPVHGKGMDAIAQVWQATLEGTVPPNEGHILSF